MKEKVTVVIERLKLIDEKTKKRILLFGIPVVVLVLIILFFSVMMSSKKPQPIIKRHYTNVDQSSKTSQTNKSIQNDKQDEVVIKTVKEWKYNPFERNRKQRIKDVVKPKPKPKTIVNVINENVQPKPKKPVVKRKTIVKKHSVKSKPPVNKPTVLSVTQITRDSGSYKALISGKTVQVGDYIRGYKVVYISSSQVMLKSSKGYKTLKIGGV